MESRYIILYYNIPYQIYHLHHRRISPDLGVLRFGILPRFWVRMALLCRRWPVGDPAKCKLEGSAPKAQHLWLPSNPQTLVLVGSWRASGSS